MNSSEAAQRNFQKLDVTELEKLLKMAQPKKSHSLIDNLVDMVKAAYKAVSSRH